MALGSSIEWTESTWNPVTGCTKVSPGCAHCYAERMARRLQAMGNANYRDGFAVRCHPQLLDLPLHWHKPQRIFVNSMSDLFHPEVPEAFIRAVVDTMRQANWHVFQVLTKRSERLHDLSPALAWPDNTWVGVSVEDESVTQRIEHLSTVDASVRFLSLEPLLGPLPNLNLQRVDWVIVGGESGPGARRMEPRWVYDIRDQCAAASVPFFFKQWGGTRKKQAGRLLDGRTYDEMPDVSHISARALAVVSAS